MNRAPVGSQPIATGVALPEDQRAQQRRRNALSLRVAVIRNGYLLTYGDTGEAEAAAGDQSRAEMHKLVDAFFDKIESQLADGTLEIPESAPTGPNSAAATKHANRQQLQEYGSIPSGPQFRRVRGEA